MDRTDHLQNGLQSSSKTLQLLPVSPEDSIFKGFQTSSLYRNFMITLENASEDNHGIEVLNLDTGVLERVIVDRHVEYINRCNHYACKKEENKIILYGGRNGDRKCSDIVILTLHNYSEFEILIEVVKQRKEPNFIIPQDSISIHFCDNKLFVLSEANLLQPKSQNRLYSFDFTSQTWTKCQVTENLPREVIEHNTVLYNGKIYLLGWRTGNEEEEYSSEFYELDLISENLEWKKIASTGLLPRARSKACMVAEDSKVFLFGGKSIEEDINLCDLFEYDIEKNIWTEIKIENVQCDLDLEYPKITGTFYKGTLFIKGLFSDEENKKKHGTAKIKIHDLSRQVIAVTKENPCDPFQTTELYKHYMVTIQRYDKKKCAIDVFNLETEKPEYVKIRGNTSILDIISHCSCRKGENQIIVSGGYGPNDSSDIVILTLDDNKHSGFTIDIAVAMQKKDPTLKSERFDCIHFFDNKLFLFGGILAIFNFASLTWTKSEVTGQYGDFVRGSVLYKGKIYIFGKTYYTKTDERQRIGIFELDLTAKEFELKFVSAGSAPLRGLGDSSMVENNGKIYIFGNNNYFSKLFEYSIDSKVWRELKTYCKFELSHQTPTGVFYNGTLFVRGEYRDGDTNKHYYTAKVQVFDPKEVAFKREMENMSVDPQSVDVRFKVQDQHFPAHKTVLSKRCQFFKNMFESGMAESTNSEIAIEDVKSSSFKAVLQFIYWNKVDLTQDLAWDLLKLADKWSFTPLKTECETFLSQQLTIENFKDIAVYLDHADAPTLENAVIEFVVKNAKNIKQRGSLIGLPQELYVNLVAKILNMKFDS